jgi:hypothetical protein
MTAKATFFIDGLPLVVDTIVIFVTPYSPCRLIEGEQSRSRKFARGGIQSDWFRTPYPHRDALTAMVNGPPKNAKRSLGSIML